MYTLRALSLRKIERLSKLRSRLKRNFARIDERTVEGVGFKRRGRRRSGKICEDACNTRAAFDYRTDVDTLRTKRETV